MSLPLKSSSFTRAKDSMYTMRVRPKPKNFMANNTYARTTLVPGPLTKRTSGGPKSQIFCAVAAMETTVLTTDSNGSSPTRRARGNWTKVESDVPSNFSNFSSYARAFSSDVVSPEETIHVSEQLPRGTGANIRSISPVCPPEPRSTIIEPVSSFFELSAASRKQGSTYRSRSRRRKAGRRAASKSQSTENSGIGG
ncbi:hypothetical protein CLUG_04871 [Clavispora lusitaniae ATCC 42720]|uniref:Uncharacterized protein n=1 Tax=Clavispora lusitaniae (strain ATCC 42720) TaxID=306902 RepID=C4Y9I1_CLAL4|nr:uncharacterized protein CLUG_04871 [Clavispora lusitaniae ATCC 42720]EEQ40744.1 hypothetical protein CLUG_04871 [Clavispora lusitaniae ATCC 42720]